MKYRTMIHLGPFLTTCAGECPEPPGLKPTGTNLEIVWNGDLYSHPIYQNTEHWRMEKPGFRDFYLARSEAGWAFDFNCRGFHVIDRGGETFLAISPFTRALYSEQGFPGDVTHFLRDFRERIWVSSHDEALRGEKMHDKVLLVPSLMNEGFAVGEVLSHGIKLEVTIDWLFRDNYEGWQSVNAGQIEFRPRCGGLGQGKWKPVHWPEGIEDLFWERLKRFAPDPPFKVFDGPENLQRLLSLFEWSEVTRRSAKELAVLRIDLVRKNRALWDDPKLLATILQAEGCYSVNTSISQIRKAIPNLIAKASGETD